MVSLHAQLKAYCQGQEDAVEAKWYRGAAKRNKETLSASNTDTEFQEAVSKWIERGKLPKLLELWVKGLKIDWHRLYQADRRPRRLSLPTYPLSKQRHWVEAAAAVPSRSKPRGTEGTFTDVGDPSGSEALYELIKTFKNGHVDMATAIDAAAELCFASS
jgi:acyl transferase domain-containing protein